MSSDDPFAYLGVSRNGATERDIKRAYAVKLKSTRPDEDPAGFMALRNAMERAIEQLHWASQYDDCDEDDDDEEQETGELIAEDVNGPEADLSDPPSTPAPRVEYGAEWGDPEPQPEEIDYIEPLARPEPPPQLNQDVTAVERAMEQVRQLFDQPFQRNAWSSWLNIIDADDVLSIEAFQMLSYHLRAEICQRSDFSPGRVDAQLPSELDPSIFLKLDERFGWSSQAVTNWYERQQNTWICRLVEQAEVSLGKRYVAWGKVGRKIEELEPASTPANKTPAFERGFNAVVSLIWLIVRIAFVIVLISSIGQVFS